MSNPTPLDCWIAPLKIRFTIPETDADATEPADAILHLQDAQWWYVEVGPIYPAFVQGTFDYGGERVDLEFISGQKGSLLLQGNFESLTSISGTFQDPKFIIGNDVRCSAHATATRL